jgi:hypothetical protein
MLQSSIELRVGVFDIVIIEKRGLGLIGSNHIDVDTRRKGFLMVMIKHTVYLNTCILNYIHS